MKLIYINRNILILVYLLLLVFPTFAQERTVGLLTYTEDAFEGYTLLAPQFNNSIFLINNSGQVINEWTIDKNAVRDAHLLENGNLIVVAPPSEKIDTSLIPNAFPPDGSIREYTWDGELIWEYQFIGPEVHHHHGIDILPNGNILVIAWEYRSLDEALMMGLDSEIAEAEFGEKRFLLPDIIQEIDRSTNEVVWEWNPWDHLVQNIDSELPNYGEPSENPNLIDLNYQSYFRKGTPSTSNAGASDWMHSNAINYNPMLDQVVLSVRSFDEFWIIDHSISTEEAKGSAGDLLYRWGNPFAYSQGDLVEDRQLFGQHDVQWIDEGLLGEGNILIFNNRDNADGREFSTILELTTPVQPDGTYDWDQGSESAWSFSADGFYASFVSGVQRLPNGNTLITEGPHGRLIEVTPDGEVVWEYVNPSTRNGIITQGEPANPEGVETADRNLLFRVRKYPVDFPGFEDKDMTPGDPLVE